MKILIEGNISKLNKVKKFLCNYCGCLFEVTKDEYKMGSQYNEIYAYCNCPFCNEIVYGEIKDD